MDISKIGRNFHVIENRYKSGQDFWFLLTSDRHWDNPCSNWDMQEKHMKQAKERGALIIDAGDFFCAMQGKYDVRSNKSSLREIHKTGEYLDSLVNTAADFFQPYQDLFAVIGKGNHETAILKRHETNLTERMVERLNAKSKSGHQIYTGGYGGFIRFSFKSFSGGNTTSMLLNYFHGHGGGGEVTKGVLQSYRRAVYMPDPDVVMSGHVHEQYIFPIQQIRVCDRNCIKHKTQYHVRIPTYKDEYDDGYDGYHIENGRPPKPIGAWWMQVIVNRKRVDGRNDTGYDINFIQAK